ncbi:MAG: hypothetical protein IK090_02310 [Clostridia bacterium]|nr:hypothetical protein [Clostridia bacterium]
MKKVALALILCLVLTVFAFASCGKGEKTDTTADPTSPATPAATDPAPGTTTAHVHIPADDYSIDEKPTCAWPGSQSRHCTVCDEIIPETVEEIPALPHTPEGEFTVTPATCIEKGLKYKICAVCGETIESTVEELPIDSNAHNVEEWSATPTVLNPTVRATGECTLCHATLEEDRTFVPDVYNSKTATSAFAVSKSAEVIRGDKHFHPTDEDIDGNDLWFEYSFLWNPSFANWTGLAEMEIAGLWNASNTYAMHRPLFYCYLRDGVKDYCPYAGHFDYTTQMPGIGKECILDPGNGQPIYQGTANSSPALGEYGWHRLGVHFHQEVAEYNETKGGVVYAGYHELFIDGLKVWVIVSNMQGNWKDGAWNTNSNKDLKSRDSLLWTATYDGGNWTYAENNVLVKVYMDASIRSTANPVYVVIDDLIWTCGDGFALNVEPVTDPVETTVTLAEGIEVPGTIYFKLAD